MAAITSILTGIGLAVSAAGTVAGIQQGQAQAKSAKAAMDIQQRQNEVEAQRGRRQIYRDMLAAQAKSEAAAANQGGLAGSALQGGLNQAANSGTQSQADLNQNLATSTALYQNKRSQVGSGNTAQALSSIGGGLTTLGQSNLIKNIGTLFKI